jgi:hypothetical protein
LHRAARSHHFLTRAVLERTAEGIDFARDQDATSLVFGQTTGSKSYPSNNLKQYMANKASHQGPLNPVEREPCCM